MVTVDELRALLARTPEIDIKLLRSIFSFDGAATSAELGSASREQDRSRQRCRRRGLIMFDGYYWRITELGSAILRAKIAQLELAKAE